MPVSGCCPTDHLCFEQTSTDLLNPASLPFAVDELLERDYQDDCDADLEPISNSASAEKSETNVGKSTPVAAHSQGDSLTPAGSTAKKFASADSASNGTSASSIPTGDGVESKKGCASWWAEAVGASWAYDWYVEVRYDLTKQ